MEEVDVERLEEIVEKLDEKAEKIRAKKEKIVAELALRKGKLSELKRRVENPYIGFLLNDLHNEKKKVEELTVSMLLRSDLPVNDWKRKRTIKKLKMSEQRVKDLKLEYQRLAFPGVSAVQTGIGIQMLTGGQQAN